MKPLLFVRRFFLRRSDSSVSFEYGVLLVDCLAADSSLWLFDHAVSWIFIPGWAIVAGFFLDALVLGRLVMRSIEFVFVCGIAQSDGKRTLI